LARMKRLQISLEAELDRKLDRAAAAEGLSKAEVVRRSLRDRLEPRSPTELPVSTSGGDLIAGIDLADGRGLREIMDGLRG
jgi:metal-responsive CopG/Arc/MetJ family transcriptional regulator